MIIYLQKSIINHDWVSAGLEPSKIIDTKFKENNTLLFGFGLVYICIYNNSVKIYTQMFILFDLPEQEILKTFGPINILLAPPGYKEVKYDQYATKQSYFDK